MTVEKCSVILITFCVFKYVSPQHYPPPSAFPQPQQGPATISGSLSLSPNLLLELMRGLPRDPPVCTFECPYGQSPTTREGHSPRYNGCGSYGVDASAFLPNSVLFTDCCNAHDICYDTCGTTKFECDARFQSCLMQRCNRVLNRGAQSPPADWSDYSRQSQRISQCLSTSRLLGAAPVLAGCNAYMDAQRNACTCYAYEY